jgi:hypothetical protein
MDTCLALKHHEVRKGTARRTAKVLALATALASFTLIGASRGAYSQTNGAIYEIEPSHASGKRLDVNGSNTSDGSYVQIWDDGNSNNQRWKFESQGNGLWEIIPQHATWTRLDVSSSGTSDGTRVQIWTDNNSNAQRWRVLDQGNGLYELEPAHAPGKRLDISASGTTNGTRAQIWTDNNTGAQRFRLLLQSGSPTPTPEPNTNKAKTGINVGFETDWAPEQGFADVIKSSRRWGSPNAPWDENAPIDANGWPTGDAGTVLISAGKNIHGTYKISFTGNANINLVASGGVIQNKVYNSSTNTTTADLVISNSAQDQINISFTGQSGGVKNVRIMRPVSPGFSTSYAPGTLFTNQLKNVISKFSTVRFLNWSLANSNQTVNWSDRTLPSYGQQNARGFGGSRAGIAWEHCIQLVNETDTDIWVNVPLKASNDYVIQLANLLKNNLEPGRRIYVEYSNEIWNTAPGFSQGNENHDLARAEVNAGGSPLNFGGETNTWTWAWRRVGKRTKEISDQFRSVFGDSAMMTRVRPVLEWQQGNLNNTGSSALEMVDYLAWQSGRSVPYYIYGGGGSAYYNPDNESDSLTIDNIWNSASFNVNNWLPGVRTDMDFCALYGIRRVAYEGGPSMDRTGHSESVKAAAWGDARMKQLVIDHHNAWNQNGGDLLVYFEAVGDYQWGFANDPNNLNTPKYQAIDTLNPQTRAAVTLAWTPPVSLAGGQFSVAKPSWRGRTTGSINLNANTDGGQWTSYTFRVTSVGNRTISVSSSAAAGQLQLFVDGYIIGNQTSATLYLQPGLHAVRVRPVSGSFDLHSISIN